MPIFAVNYDHPDETGWQQHLLPHIAWLRDRVADGSLLASGPFTGETGKSALLLFNMPDLQSLEQLIAHDPFAREGLVHNLTIRHWDPIFGAFNSHSSRPVRTA
ncbi:YciI family protein [Sandarakinorhabdus sp.]|jgi:hypothetical protein|uniref:YciI family protein n=1 Tax=Sandarakinorhabdus sp. TaxID=1916663 RepID=UPI0035631216